MATPNEVRLMGFVPMPGLDPLDQLFDCLIVLLLHQEGHPFVL
jgi:hypothetical protein